MLVEELAKEGLSTMVRLTNNQKKGGNIEQTSVVSDVVYLSQTSIGTGTKENTGEWEVFKVNRTAYKRGFERYYTI